ncbi:MAG TPA: SpoIID/LytB domain-containing protein [Solirubrobacteraceae bacterium]|nr:SpoIID/LytB domain-containing protein [Solirubrobacteraceae bacterium]
MSRFRQHAVPITVAVALASGAAAAGPAAAADRFVIRGAGFGHGVGMSQYGAMGFAKQGKTYREILAHYYSGTQIGKLDADPIVRVLLQSRGTVAFTGAAQAGDKRLDPSKTYTASSFGGAGVVVKTSAGKRVKTFTSPLRIVGPGGNPWRLVGGQNSGTYRGALELRAGISSSGLAAINAVTLESYVRGVISRESPASWPAEALKAQALAARTYAITTNKPGTGFDHYADTRSQVYAGVAAETPATDAAVAATAHEVVIYDGKPVTTYFFSTSGGKTENNETSALGGSPQPWLRSVEDPYDNVSPKHRWGPIRLTTGQAGAKLRGLVKGSFKGIEVVKRGASPRIVSAEIVGTRGRTTVNGATLRARFGLNDSWAYFTTVGTEVDESRTSTDETDPGSGGTVARLATAAATRRNGVVHGRIIGMKRGTVLKVERRTAAGVWSVETTVKLRKNGRYRATVARTGAYRVRAGSIVGPVAKLR